MKTEKCPKYIVCPCHLEQHTVISDPMFLLAHIICQNCYRSVFCVIVCNQMFKVWLGLDTNMTSDLGEDGGLG